MRLLVLLCSFCCLLTACSTVKPAARDNAAVASPAVAALLQPNDPSLPYPIYADFTEIEPLFRQNDNITYVVNFWATWCRPCLAEMPHFEQLATSTDRDDVQVILISLDRPGDVRTKMKDFVLDRPLNLPVVSFTDDNFRNWIGRVDRSWSRGSIPATLFYRNGNKYFNQGQISSYAELQGLVRRVQ